jgi:hypothetical protein
VKLDPIGDGQPVPADCDISIVCDRFVGSGIESRRERLRDFPLERIARDIAHLGTDGIEALSFTLSDLDGQQLEQMPVSVRCTGASPFGPIE